MKYFSSTIVVLLALGGVSGCGTEDPSENTTDAATGPLLPWKIGNTWTYRVTDSDNNTVTKKITTVGPEETVGGSGPHKDEVANKVTTSKDDGVDLTVSYQKLDGERVVRYRELSYHATDGTLELEEHWDPYKLHIDWTHLDVGYSWLETYNETKIPQNGDATTTGEARDRWTLVAVGETIVVPKDTYSAYVFTKAGSSNSKTYWYVPGVGKVKETGATGGQIEELEDFTLQ